MKLVTLVIAVVSPLVARSAGADPRWRLDLSARGVGSVELDPGAPQMRDAVVPAFAIRGLYDLGLVQVGATLGAGFPAWYGKTELAVSIDRERVLAKPRCELVIDDGIGREECGARWSIAAGLDAGVGMLYFDAPPETPPASDALVYWGPLARARVQLHVVDMLPTSRAIGLVVGANLALASAHYLGTAQGTGLRLEPELELGLTMRL